MRIFGLGDSGDSSSPLLAVIIAMQLASGCASTDAYRYDSGAFALNGSLNAAECNQTDSTVTCCLKQHPGQYELCGATPPAKSKPINVGPPGLRSLEEGEQKEARETNEESRETGRRGARITTPAASRRSERSRGACMAPASVGTDSSTARDTASGPSA